MLSLLFRRAAKLGSDFLNAQQRPLASTAARSSASTLSSFPAMLGRDMRGTKYSSRFIHGFACRGFSEQFKVWFAYIPFFSNIIMVC